MATRKTIKMLVTVSVPLRMTPAQARREVRELITHQRGWSADLGDVKAKTVRPAPKVHDVRAFQLAHGLESDGIIGEKTSAALKLASKAKA